MLLKRKVIKQTRPYLWTLLRCGVEGTAHYPPLGSFHAPSDKLVIYGVLHINTRTCCTALACVEERALVGLFNRHIHCGKSGLLANKTY